MFLKSRVSQQSAKKISLTAGVDIPLLQLKRPLAYTLHKLWFNNTIHIKLGSEKPGFFKKAQTRVFRVLLRFGLNWFFGLSVEQAVGKIVGWFSSSDKLLFRFTSTLDYPKICKFITYQSLEAVNIRKSLTIMPWQIKIESSLVRVFCWDFSTGLPPNPIGFWVLPGCLNPTSNC